MNRKPYRSFFTSADCLSYRLLFSIVLLLRYDLQSWRFFGKRSANMTRVPFSLFGRPCTDHLSRHKQVYGIIQWLYKNFPIPGYPSAFYCTLNTQYRIVSCRIVYDCQLRDLDLAITFAERRCWNEYAADNLCLSDTKTIIICASFLFVCNCSLISRAYILHTLSQISPEFNWL